MVSFVTNSYGQPVGLPVPNWRARSLPMRTPLQGRFCRLEPLDATRHAADLFNAYCRAADGRHWTYLFVGPFSTEAEYRTYCEQAAISVDPLHFAVVDLVSGRAVGTMAYMRMDPANGVVEVGNVTFSPLLQRASLSTEAQYLFMRRAFDELGYRRYEWKCDSLNAPSRQAAVRLGFQFEGIFRQALIYKGRSRDTAWFSVIDAEWPALRAAFEAWLAPDNFDAAGRQRKSLAACRVQGSDSV